MNCQLKIFALLLVVSISIAAADNLGGHKPLSLGYYGGLQIELEKFNLSRFFDGKSVRIRDILSARKQTVNGILYHIWTSVLVGKEGKFERCCIILHQSTPSPKVKFTVEVLRDPHNGVHSC